MWTSRRLELEGRVGEVDLPLRIGETRSKGSGPESPVRCERGLGGCWKLSGSWTYAERLVHGFGMVLASGRGTVATRLLAEKVPRRRSSSSDKRHGGFRHNWPLCELSIVVMLLGSLVARLATLVYFAAQGGRIYHVT